MKKQPVVNGINTADLFGTIEAIKGDSEIAQFKFRLKNKWMNGGLNCSLVDNYFGAKQEMQHAKTFEMTNDEPPVLLSGDKGPNPVENLLHALAGCLTTSLVYHAAARGIEVKGVSTRFEGDLDLHGFLGLSDKVRRGFREIRVKFEIDGNIDEKTKLHLIAMAQHHSPVFDMVSNGTQVVAMLDDTAQKKAA